MPSLFNHLIDGITAKTVQLLNLQKKMDKISEISIFNVKLT